MEEMLAQQENRWWSIKIQSFKSKEHFLRYAGRYVRRPPIAQRRITYIGERTVTFWFNDKKLRRRVYGQCSLEEFVDRWAATHSGTLSARCSQLWAVCPAHSQANLGSHLCNSGTGAKATPQTSPLGRFPQARLRTRSAPRPNWQKDEMGATTRAGDTSLDKRHPRMLHTPTAIMRWKRPAWSSCRSSPKSASGLSPHDGLNCGFRLMTPAATLQECVVTRTRDFDFPILRIVRSLGNLPSMCVNYPLDRSLSLSR